MKFYKERVLTKIVLLFAFYMVAGCATGRRLEPVKALAPSDMERGNRSADQRAAHENADENIDMEGLERSLFRVGDSTRLQDDLGYREVGFNTCAAGFGFSSAKACRKMVMTVLHIRLQCRDSEGTISNALGSADLVAISGQTLKWSLQRHDGAVVTDGDGFATLKALFSKSPSHDWLKLAVGSRFLNMRAGDVARVVVPRTWCDAE